MLETKEISVKQQDETEKTYIISKFPAIAGREIVTQYPLTGLPKIGEYASNEELMYKLMKFVGVPRDTGAPLMLTTKDLINNHVDSWETLLRIEAAMMEYNCSFFQNGRISSLFEDFVQKAQQWITKTLIPLSPSSSKKVKQH